jgi:hypothetical protein
MQSAFIITDNNKNPYAVISILAGGTEFYPIAENAKDWAKWMADDFSTRKISKAELTQTLDSSLSIEGPLTPNRSNKIKIDELIKKATPTKASSKSQIKLDKKSLGFNTEEDFMLPVISIMDIQINDFTNSEWKNGINFKSMSFLADSNKSTFTYEIKRTRATWDPSLAIPGTERRGGFRCPVGTRYGGQITDRFGRNCGWGVARRLANQLTDVGERLEDASDDRRKRRVDRRNARMLRRLNKPGQSGTQDTPLNDAINSYIRRGQPTPGTPAAPAPAPATARTPRTPGTPRTPRPTPSGGFPSPTPTTVPGTPAPGPIAPVTPVWSPPSGRPGYPSRPINVTPTPNTPGSKPKPDKPTPPRPRRPRKPAEVRPKPETNNSSKPAPLPKDITPAVSETLEAFKDRKYNEHQRRVREMRERGDDVGLLRREEWEKTHGPTVEKEWNARQTAKPASGKTPTPDSAIPLPDIIPQQRETLEDFKDRKYNEHQRRVREAIERGENVGLLRRSEWEKFHGPTVEKEWNARQAAEAVTPDAKPPKPPKDLISKVPVPRGAPSAAETLQQYKDRKYNEHQRRVREIRERGGEAGFLNREEWDKYHGPAVEEAYNKARQRTPGRAERRTTAEERGATTSSRKPAATDVPDAVQPRKKKKKTKDTPSADVPPKDTSSTDLPEGWNQGPGTIITHENGDIIDQEPIGGKWFVVNNGGTNVGFANREDAIAWHEKNVLKPAVAPPSQNTPQPSSKLSTKWGFGARRRRNRPAAFEHLGAVDKNGNSVTGRLTKEESPIKTKAQAVDHIKNGGSISEVPDEFLHVALEGNSVKVRDIIGNQELENIRLALERNGIDPEDGWYQDALFETASYAYLQSLDPDEKLPDSVIAAIGDSKFIEVVSGSAAQPRLYFGVVDGRLVRQGFVVKIPDDAMTFRQKDSNVHELIGTEMAQFFGFAQEAGRRDGKINGKPTIVLPFIHNASEENVVLQPFKGEINADEKQLLRLFNFGMGSIDSHTFNNFETDNGHVSPVDFGRLVVDPSDSSYDSPISPRAFQQGGIARGMSDWQDSQEDMEALGPEGRKRIANLFRERVAAIDWDAMRARHNDVWSENDAATVRSREYGIEFINLLEARMKAVSTGMGEDDAGGFLDWSQPIIRS